MSEAIRVRERLIALTQIGVASTNDLIGLAASEQAIQLARIGDLLEQLIAVVAQKRENP